MRMWLLGRAVGFAAIGAIAAMVVLALVFSRQERICKLQLPAPIVPMPPAEVRVKAVERKAEPVEQGGVAAESGAVAVVCGIDEATAARYEYAPFGAVIAQSGPSAVANPWRFSSEYAEDDTATVYYNYRHYEPTSGRWCSRDAIEEEGEIVKHLFSLVDNSPHKVYTASFSITPIYHDYNQQWNFTTVNIVTCVGMVAVIVALSPLGI